MKARRACHNGGVRAVLFLSVACASCRSGPEPRANPDVKIDAEVAIVDAAVQVEAALADRTLEPGARSLEPPSVATDWCIEGMKGLDEDVCYVLPELRAGPRRLLVYLHGIVPPTKESVQKQTVQGAVLNAARRAGAAAIVPRGRRGIGPEGASDWWAWPTSPATHAKLVKEIVARWVAAKTKLEGIAGAPFERTYLAGSSNGAYFLSALALRGDCDELGFPIAGYGAMSGGAPGGRGADALAGRAPRPVYVGFGTYDAETKSGARALAAVCGAARWPVRIAEHPFGHGAREIYLDEAFTFWDAEAAK
jgi:predicted esterase